MKNNLGFTLIELIIVIAIVGVLLAISLVAINPSRQFATANNQKRQGDVTAILNAIGQYIIDQKGVNPPEIPSTAAYISKASIDLCSLIVPTYIAALPSDPQLGSSSQISDCGSQYNTFYQVSVDANGRLRVSAPGTELGGDIITATR